MFVCVENVAEVCRIFRQAKLVLFLCLQALPALILATENGIYCSFESETD